MQWLDDLIAQWTHFTSAVLSTFFALILVGSFGLALWMILLNAQPVIRLADSIMEWVGRYFDARWSGSPGRTGRILLCAVVGPFRAVYAVSLWVRRGRWRTATQILLSSVTLFVVSAIAVGLIEGFVFYVLPFVLAFGVFRLFRDSTRGASQTRPGAAGGGDIALREQPPLALLASAPGEYRERNVFGSRYFERWDASGKLMDTLHEYEGLAGERYFVRLDTHGKRISELREYSGPLNDKYVRETDASGNVISEARDWTGLLGDRYARRTDATGELVSESRERTGVLNDSYIETRETGGDR